MGDLNELLVDREELDRGLLAETLLPLIGIDRNTLDVVPKPGWNALSAEGKIIVYLLARKAMVAMPDLSLDVEGALPQEIERNTGVRGGTLRPRLREMLADALLAQDSAGRYFVPVHAVLRARESIVGGSTNGQGRNPSGSARRSRARRSRR
jgi:hypothetical protein